MPRSGAGSLPKRYDPRASRSDQVVVPTNAAPVRRFVPGPTTWKLARADRSRTTILTSPAPTAAGRSETRPLAATSARTTGGRGAVGAVEAPVVVAPAASVRKLPFITCQ